MSVFLVRHTMVLLAMIFSFMFIAANGKSILNEEQSRGNSQDQISSDEMSDTAKIEVRPIAPIIVPVVSRIPRWAVSSDDILSNINNNNLLAYIQKPLQRFAAFSKKRSSCMFDAGMTHNCDFKEYIQSHQARKIYGDPTGPGKRSMPSTLRLMRNNAGLGQQELIDGADIFSNYNQAVTNEPQLLKRMECLSGLPGGDCENSFLGSESLGQDFLRPGGRNPGRR